MSRVADEWSALWPALAFLLAGVPLAALLDELGFFDASAALVLGRSERARPVLGLWALAAATTVVLNLDTTIVLLTPLYLRIARRSDIDPINVVVIPLLLASLASSVLPVSNLTTLIVADKFDLRAIDVLAHLALPSLVAVAVGWFFYARRFPTHFAGGTATDRDRRALLQGGTVVSLLLVGFVAGPSVGVDAWAVAAVADVVLVILVGRVPWRAVPVVTAAGVAALATVVALAVPADALAPAMRHSSPAALVAIASGAAVVANIVNNLPALLVALEGVHRMTWGMWSWLLGVNAAAVLLPVGALANLLWLRIMRAEGLAVGWRRYVSVTVPIALPAFLSAVAVLVLERTIAG